MSPTEKFLKLGTELGVSFGGSVEKIVEKIIVMENRDKRSYPKAGGQEANS